MAKNLTSLAAKCIDINSHPDILKLYGSFLKCGQRQGVVLSENLRGVGSGCKINLPASKIVVIQNLV